MVNMKKRSSRRVLERGKIDTIKLMLRSGSVFQDFEG